MDDMERAQERALFDTGLAVQRQVGRLRTGGPRLIDRVSGAVLCRACEEPIPVDRLKAQPGCDQCAPCARLEEQQQMALRGGRRGWR
jgi:RNA polymerase-binding transcription factor DksA